LERAVAEWHVLTLFVSHDQFDVRRLADRVIVVEGGKVIAGGPTAEVASSSRCLGEQRVLGTSGPQARSPIITTAKATQKSHPTLLRLCYS
jgi:ABC-type molybdate transport system ATPase subunit